MKTYTLTSFIKFVALFTFVIIIFNTCKKKEPELTPQPANNVIVLSDSTELNNITSYDDTTGQITFSNPVDYSIDYIIVSEPSTAAPDGFLRRITGIESDKKTKTVANAAEEVKVKQAEVVKEKKRTAKADMAESVKEKKVAAKKLAVKAKTSDAAKAKKKEVSEKK